MKTTLDTYRQLGDSGLFVSPLCLGAMGFGEEWGWGASEPDSLAVLERYLAAGGNFIDTANVYTQGSSERIVGKALAGHRRDSVVLATKGSLNFGVRDPNAGGNSRKAITRAVNDSLARLGTDWIDLYWLHVHDGATPVHESLRAIDDLVRAGKIRYVGLSNYPVRKVVEWQLLARQHGLAQAVAAQYEYNLLTRQIEIEHAAAFAEFGIGQVPWGPLAQGVLSGKYTRENHRPEEAHRSKGEMQQARLTERAFVILDAVRAVASETDSSVVRVALAWLRTRPTVVSPIVGVRTVAQLDELIAALALELPAAAIARLDEASHVELVYPWNFIAPERMDRMVRGGTSTERWTAR